MGQVNEQFETMNAFPNMPLPNTTASKTVLATVTLAQTAVIAINAGIRTVTLACSGAKTTDDLVIQPVGALPAGYAVHNAVCTSAGQVQVTLTAPLLAIGAAYSIPCRVVALR
jgi:hypothetical protein